MSRFQTIIGVGDASHGNASHRIVNRRTLNVLLLIALVLLSLQLYFARQPFERGYRDAIWTHAEQGSAELSLRNTDFPNTFVSSIHVDLTSPRHSVTLTCSGPKAAQQVTGPFHSSPGCGTGTNNCDDVAESNRSKSNCTPKGRFVIQGFSDTMASIAVCKFVTWINASREIAFHSYPDVPDHPASHGCVRLDEHAAQLIHNNSVAGRTEVVIDGSWTNPNAQALEK